MNIAKGFFWLSSIILALGYGVVVGHFKVFPYSMIESGARALVSVYWDREVILGLRPTGLLRPARYEGSGVTRFLHNEASPGVTLVTSFFDGGNEIRLIRMDGSVVHRWPVRFFKIFTNRDHIPPEDIPHSEWNFTIHGALVLPDGSVVFNFEYLGMAKLDRCGKVQWTVPRITHHSLERAEDGGFWVPSARYWVEESPFPLLKPPFNDQTILKVSADGKVVSEMSVLDLFFKNHLEALLFSNGLRGTEVASDDLAHLNDIEELSSEMAPAFPEFEAGDLLLSMRNLNLIMVVDPRSQKVKWHQTGPWIAQHDPDFQRSGIISVFNNNDDRTETGSILGGSNIIEVDPATGKTDVRYGKEPNQRIFSYRRGKHQYLPNGNVLITETESGRVFEVNGRGDIVWEFVNRYDDKRVAIVMGATRYSDDYFNVRDWKCHD